MFARLVSRRFVVAAVCVSAMGTAVLFRFDFGSKANPGAALPLTVTKSSTLVPVGDGNADPGETIEHTIVIANGGTAATNVQLTDALQSITTLNGTVAVSPIAVNDTYSSIGNVGINVPDGASDLLGNDTNPGGAGTLIITSAPTTSTQGGNVSVNLTTGSFTYNPPPGFEGADSFTYTLGNGSGLTDTATVAITVTGMIWFVNASAGVGGDGRLSTPFNCFVGTNCFDDSTLDATGDNIFLYSGAYTGGQTLLNNQRLIGQGATAPLAGPSSVTGITIPSFSNPLPVTGGARPTMTTTAAATNALTLGSGNTLRGFNIGNTAAVDISGTGFGTLTVLEIDLNGTGRPLSLTNGALAATFDSLTSTSAAGGAGINLTGVSGNLTVAGTTSITSAGAQGINVSGSSVVANFGTSTTVTDPLTQGILVGTQTGNLTFGNTSVSDATDAISLQNNSAGTRAFGTITTINGTGDSFAHEAGGGTTTVSGLATLTNPGSNCIDIQDSTTAVTFANVNCTGSAATGVFLDDNSGAITFADLDIDTDLNVRAFHATEPHTGTITTTSGTLADTGTATAVEITGTSAASRTPLNMQLTSVSATGGANGIILSNTSSSGSPGGFRILGSGGICTEASPGTCSGGQIQNTVGGDVNPVATSPAGTAVVLRNVNSVFLTRIRINGNQNYGIHGLNVDGFTLDTSVVHGVNGTNVASPFRDSSVRFDQLTGTNSITNSLISGGFQHNLLIDNQSGTSQITVSGCTIKNTNGVTGDDGFQLEAEITAVLNAFVTNNSFAAHGGDHMNVSLINGADVDFTFTGNFFTGGHSVGLGQGLFILGSNFNGSFTYDISNNGTAAAPLVGNKQGGMIHVNKGSGTGTFNGRIQNNFIGNSAVTGSGSEQAFGIYASARGAGGGHNTLISSNSVRQYFDRGIVMEAGEGSASFNATVTNNTVANFADAVNSLHGIHSDNGILGTDTNAVCIDMQDNLVANAGNEPAGGADIRLRKGSQAGLSVRIPGLVGTTATDADNKITAENPNATTVTVTGANYTGGAACPQPTLPSAPTLPSKLNEREIAAAPSLIPLSRSLFDTDVWSLVVPDVSSPARKPKVQHGNPEIGKATNTDHWAAISEFANRLAKMMSPTVYSQEKPAAPEGAGDVNVGPFGIPANESITIRFNVTVNNGPYASGLDNITNTATVTADGGVSQSSNTTSIALDAAPDLIVTKTDGGGTKQPGTTLVYALSYSNANAVNGQDTTNVVLTETIPANTIFNAGASSLGWGGPGCVDGAPAGTTCTFVVPGIVAAGAAPVNLSFAVNVLAALPAGAASISNTSSISDDGGNGTDRNAANNAASENTLIVGNWDGDAGTNWDDPANWSNDLPPGDNVSIPNVANAPAIHADVVHDNVVLNGENLTVGAGATLTINAGAALGANTVDGAGMLELGPAASISRTSGGQVNAILKKDFATNGPFTYHVGTPGQYSPVQVNLTAGNGSLSVKANAGTAPAVQVLNDATTLDRYWTLTEAGDLTADVTFNYLQADVDGNEGNYRTIRVIGGDVGVFPNGAPCPGSGNPCVDSNANTIFVAGLQVFSDWTAGELAPTAAAVNVSGRVIASDGRGLKGAMVWMMGVDGNVKRAMTSPFGYFRFFDVQVGETYVISVQSKRYFFVPQVHFVNDELTDLSFVGEPR